jgi:hypothetical protein
MKTDRELEQLFRQEFRDILPNTIWQNDNGVYEVFGCYQISKQKLGYTVTNGATDVGVFATTRSALSWCIADKNHAYNTAREILTVDNKLNLLTQDINTRSAVGDRSQDPAWREIILTKLETKVIHKKQLENQLAKCVNWAKYCQQKGFNNETARTGRGQPNKTSR